MIFDCFNFFNELEILDIRLNTLDSVVDKFILVESTVTHTNQPKPLYYRKNKNKFKKFRDKIVHVIIDDSPNVSVPWIIINYQMSEITRGLKLCKPKPKDTILVSCVDEIPRPEKIIEWKDKPGKHKVFLQSVSYYFLNCVDYTTEGRWDGTRMFTFKDLMSYKSPYIARFTPADVLIPDGGWHFSNVGDVKKIQYKLTVMPHQEYNKEKYNTPEHIKMAIAEGKDFLDHGRKFEVKDASFLPEYVQNNRSKFNHLIAKKLQKESLSYSFYKRYFQAKKIARLGYRKIRSFYNDEKNFFQKEV